MNSSIRFLATSALTLALPACSATDDVSPPDLYAGGTASNTGGRSAGGSFGSTGGKGTGGVTSTGGTKSTAGSKSTGGRASTGGRRTRT